MKNLIFTISIAALFAIRMPAAEPEATEPQTSEPKIDKETARNAIRLFRQEPLTRRGRAAGEIVRSFAERSSDVGLNVNPRVAPFLSNMKLVTEDRALLLDAFIVGNVDSQLMRNERKDDPYAGVMEVINVYQLAQKNDPNMHLPEIDEFIGMEKRGELKNYISAPYTPESK